MTAAFDDQSQVVLTGEVDAATTSAVRCAATAYTLGVDVQVGELSQFLGQSRLVADEVRVFQLSKKLVALGVWCCRAAGIQR